MTKNEYHAIVEDYDQHLIDLAIDQIPLNINRAGTLYRKKLKEIYETHQPMERSIQR